MSSKVALGAAYAVILTSFMAGCADEPHVGTADCSRGVSFEGREYVEAGFVDDVGAKAGTAVRAECHDNGKDAPGLVFADDGTPVTVWLVDSVDPTQAVGLEVESRYAVMFNQELSDQDRLAIQQTLGIAD